MKAFALAALANSCIVSSAPACSVHKQPRAIYFMTNTAQNNIVALPVQQDGTLAQGCMTPTGGKGLQEISAMTGQPAAPDGLSSQDSVVVSGDVSIPTIESYTTKADLSTQHLFAVNSGSNTLSMFRIGRQDPTKLTPMGQPVDVNGEFPVSVAVSRKDSIACVASTGAKAGVSCGKFSGAGMGQMDQLRSLSLDLQQSTPPLGPLDTVGDILFSGDEKTLYAVVKGNMTLSQPGGVAAYPVKNGIPATTPVSNNQLNGTAVLFGTVPIPGSDNLFATDASFGTAILSAKNGGGALSVQNTFTIPDQKATCWSTISPSTKTAFVTDAAFNHLVEMDTTTGQMIMEYNLTTPAGGNIDLKAAGDFLYALAPGVNTSSAVQVFDLSAGKGQAKQIQYFLAMNTTIAVQGMAIKA